MKTSKASAAAPPKERGKVPRLYLGVILGAMALGQAVSWDAFTDAVASYDVAGGAATAVVLFTLEVVTSLGLLTNRSRLRLPVAALGVVVTGPWTLLAVQAFARGLVIPNCGCFGAYLTQELRWWVLLEDAAFVGLAALHLHNVRASMMTLSPLRARRASP